MVTIANYAERETKDVKEFYALILTTPSGIAVKLKFINICICES